MLKFEWDINKANAHQKKQGVTFKEASTVFSRSQAPAWERLPSSSA